MGLDLRGPIARPPAKPAVALRLGHGRVVALVALVALVAAAPAAASWNADGSGNGYAKADQLGTGQQPTTSVSGRDVTVSWSAPTGGAPPTGYVVKRYTTGGAAQTIGASCSGTITGTTCTESSVASGTWRYTVTPVRSAWIGTESAPSADTTVAGTPTLSLTPTTISSAPATLTGSITNFASGQTVTFRLDDPSTGTVLSGSIAPSPVPASGTADVSVTIPTGIPDGSHTVYAVGSGGDQASTAITTSGDQLVYAGTGPAAARTSSGDLIVDYPAGTSQNDLVLLTEINNANQNITTPAGWTLLADQPTSSPTQMRFTVWYKLAGASESSVTLKVSTNSAGATAWVTRYRRPNGTPNPSLATGTVRQGVAGATSTLTPSPDVTTDQASATAISVVAIKAANTLSLGTPSGFALQHATTATNRALGFADIAVPTSGTAPPSPTWSQSGTAAQWAWATFAFR